MDGQNACINTDMCLFPDFTPFKILHTPINFKASVFFPNNACRKNVTKMPRVVERESTQTSTDEMDAAHRSTRHVTEMQRLCKII